MMEEEMKNMEEILNKLGKLNEKFNEYFELEAIKRSQDISSLMEEKL